MTRRDLILLLPAVLVPLQAETGSSLRGRLRQESGSAPVLIPDGGGAVVLEGDPDTINVLRDPRLKAEEFEVHGTAAPPDAFRIDPIHSRSLFVWRKGRKLVITYWCEVCAIRAWTPGKCQCCQDDLALDPRDPALKDTDPSD